MSTTFEKLMNGADGGLALLQVLAENSFDSVLITDASAEGKIIYANKSFKKLTGHDPSAIIGKTPRILQGTGTDSKVIARLSAALKFPLGLLSSVRDRSSKICILAIL